MTPQSVVVRIVSIVSMFAVLSTGDRFGLIKTTTPDDSAACIGIFLDADYMLTSANCVLNTPEMVYLFDGMKATNRTLMVESVTIHPDYNPKTNESNLAVLKFNPPLPNTDAVLQTTFETPPLLSLCEIMLLEGNDNGEYTVKPQNLTSLDNVLCNITTQLDTMLKENTLCATVQLRAGIPSHCQSGIGSPLVCEGKLAGLLMATVACNEEMNSVGVYSDISRYNTWIDDVFKTITPLEPVTHRPVYVAETVTTEGPRPKGEETVNRSQFDNIPQAPELTTQSDTVTPIPTVPDEVKTFCTPDNRNCMQEWKFLHRDGYEISNHKCINEDQIYTCLYVKKQVVAVDPAELRIYNTHNHYYFKNMSPSTLKFTLPVPNIDQVLNKLEKN